MSLSVQTRQCKCSSCRNSRQVKADSIDHLWRRLNDLVVLVAVAAVVVEVVAAGGSRSIQKARLNHSQEMSGSRQTIAVCQPLRENHCKRVSQMKMTLSPWKNASNVKNS